MDISYQMKKSICHLIAMLCLFCVFIFPDHRTYAQPVNHAPRNHTLSLDFQNIEIRALLQLIARSSGLNFVISDTVQGNISIKLKNVTWEQALMTVLQSHGLGSRRLGNVVYVSTLDDIASSQLKQFQSQEQLINLSPLHSRIVNLKYSNAKMLAELIKSAQNNLLTPRGQIAVDTRTNSVIIRDVESNLLPLILEIKKLDVPAKQVLIEARIVNIDVTFEEQLGVRFGVSNTTHLSGTFEAANEITSGTSPGDVTDPLKRLNFNIPARQLFNGSTPASVALALARLGPLLLDLELSALEAEKHAKIIAKPHVVTSNQQKAIIQTGEEIPYQQSTSSGATSVSFKNAVLSLEIVPQITPTNKIFLNIKATQDSRGESITVGATATAGSVTIPAINTQAVESSILLNDNETIVIGGVYKVVKENDVDRVPFFGTLPVIGYLFKHTGTHDEKHELLIFITPKIIQSGCDTFVTNLAPAKVHADFKQEA